MKKILYSILAFILLISLVGCSASDPFVLSGAGVNWGSITGTLSNQTDLQAALNAKQDALGYVPVQSVTATSPLSSTGGQNPNISIDPTAFSSNTSSFPWMPDQQALKYSGSSYLTNSVANFRSADSSGAIEVWFRTGTTATTQMLVASADTATTTSQIYIYVAQTTGKLTFSKQNAGGNIGTVTGNTNVSDGKFHNVVVSSNGTKWSIFLDSVAETLTPSGADGNNGDWFGDITLRDNLTIGSLVDTSPKFYFNGDIAVTRIYSRPLLAPEALTNYQRGRKATASNVTGLVYDLNLNEQSGNPVDKVGSLTMTRQGTILPTWLNSDGVFTAQGKTVLFTGSSTMNMTDGGTNQFNNSITSPVAILSSAPSITRSVSTDRLELSGGVSTGGYGALLQLWGFAATPTGNFRLFTPNAAFNADVRRLDITNGTNATANWTSITHSGLALSGALDANSQKITNLAAPTANGDAVRYGDNITLVNNARVKWSDNATTPLNTTVPVAWLPVLLPDGTTAYIPAYK